MQESICQRCFRPGIPGQNCSFCQDSENYEDCLAVGTRLHQGRYQVGRTFDRDWWSIEYHGWDHGPGGGRIVLREFFPRHFASRFRSNGNQVVPDGSEYEGYRAQYLQEAIQWRSLGKIPHLERVLDVFQENNTVYLVLEDWGEDSVPLSEADREELPVPMLLEQMSGLMFGLNQLHEMGAVHRDICPGNLQVVRRGGQQELLLTNPGKPAQHWGLEMGASTMADPILFYAPMEFYSSNGRIGPYTDVYGLCATLYYLVTGKVPPGAIQRSMGYGEPDWAALLQLNDKQRWAVRKGMAMNPWDRFPNMLQLEAALRLLPGEEYADFCDTGFQTMATPDPEPFWVRQHLPNPIEGPLENRNPPPVPPVSPVSPPAARKPRKLPWVLAAAGVILAGAVLLALTGKPRPEPEPVLAEMQTPQAEPVAGGLFGDIMGEFNPAMGETPQAEYLAPHPLTGDATENFDAHVSRSAEGMTVVAPGLCLQLGDDRSFSAELTGLAIQDSHPVDKAGSQQYFVEVYWTMVLLSDTEEVEFTTSIYNREPGKERRVTPGDMNHQILVRKEDGGMDQVGTIDGMEYDAEHIHWEGTVPRQGSYEHNKDLEVPFDYRNFHSVKVRIYNKNQDLFIIRNYDLNP